MSSYRKDKSNIYFSIDGCRGEYRFDINTGILYGIRGKPLKSYQRYTFLEVLQNCKNNSNLERILRLPFTTKKLQELPAYVKSFMGADKMDSLLLPVVNYDFKEYEYVNDNIKFFKDWFSQHPDATYFSPIYQACEFDKIKSALPSTAQGLTAEMYYNLKRELSDISLPELISCAYYLVKGKYWNYHGGCVNKLTQYLRYCRVLEKTPQKTNNFMREYVETAQTYNLHKQEFDNKAMLKVYAKKEKAWQFSFGNYIIVTPKTTNDIIREGEEMHHCVGGYTSRVVEGRTYICFVRHKDKPDIPYITCQVKTDGQIGQYFLSYDRLISSEEDKAFKQAFAEHLNKVWDE